MSPVSTVATRPRILRFCLALSILGAAALVSPLHGQGQRGAPAKAAAAPAVPGNGTIYLGSYKGAIQVIDEATEKITGEIPTKSGIPGRVTFSQDRSKIYVTEIQYEKFEIVDRVKQQSIDTFTLTEGNAKTRIWGLTPDPFDKYAILTIKKYTLATDHWEIGPPTLVQYDFATRKITRTIPWPKGEEREGIGILFSPDGKLMYMLAEDILIYETTNFTEVDKWELARPAEPGGGVVSFGGYDPFSDEPGFYTGIFTSNDPLQNRRVMGIGRIDLLHKKVEFHPVGPTRPLSYTVSPDHTRAVGMMSDIGEYEFWSFDLERYAVLKRAPFPGRPRMSLRFSSNGNYIYVFTAGNTIDLWDATSLTFARTITLDGDMTSFRLLPPAAPPRR